MAYTLDQYNNLLAAIAQGARRVRYGDKEVEYRSLDEMLNTKRQMETDLGISDAANGGQGRPSRIYISASKGA